MRSQPDRVRAAGPCDKAESMTTERQTTGQHNNSATAIFHWQPTSRHNQNKSQTMFFKNSPTIVDTHRQNLFFEKGCKRNIFSRSILLLKSLPINAAQRIISHLVWVFAGWLFSTYTIHFVYKSHQKLICFCPSEIGCTETQSPFLIKSQNVGKNLLYMSFRD